MRHTILAALLVASAPAAIAAPTPKDQLLVPPKDAAHYVVISTAGKHGDEYAWKLPDGRLAFRQSILLRGLIFETDETMRFGSDNMPSEIVIRGVTPSGDAAENYAVSGGQASWTSPVDQGSAPYANGFAKAATSVRAKVNGWARRSRASASSLARSFSTFRSSRKSRHRSRVAGSSPTSRR